MTRLRFAFILLVMNAAAVAAQTDVRGVVVDAVSEDPLPAASVLAFGPDSTQVGASTDPDGAFHLALTPGTHRLRVSFIGYRTGELPVTVGDAPIDLGVLMLRPDTTALGETVVEALATRVILRGDTTVFNADAYGVNPDATVGDLLRRLPGVTMQDGELRANGEAVDRVLVDGKEFFGDDPSAALENLPADAVDEVEIYDRASDQADFTGFDDGEEERTVNFVTKPERRRSVFGRGQLGLGSGLRYASGGNLNLFDGDRRLSGFFRADNVDFRTQMALQGDGQQPGPQVFRFYDGLTRTIVGGANVNDQWGEDVEVSASYSASSVDNTRDVSLSREYVLAEVAGQRYDETTASALAALNHDLSARLDATLSERTEMTVEASVRAESSDTENDLGAATYRPEGTLLSRTQTESDGGRSALDANVTAELRHRFVTEGRTLSGEVSLGTDGSDGDSAQEIERLYFFDAVSTPDSVDAFGRRVDTSDLTRTVRGELTYSEPLSEAFQLLVAYRPSVSMLDADQEALRRDAADAYTILDSTATSFADQRQTQHTLGADLQHKRDKLTTTVGLAARSERLAFTQAGPRAFEVTNVSRSLLPSLRVDYQMQPQSSLNLTYRTNTDQPEARQLRDVIDDSNALLLSSGNPDLRTARSHNVSLRYRTASPEKGTSLSANAQLSFTRDYIGTARVTAGAAPLAVLGVVIPPGGQLSYPVNLDGQFQAGSFLTYGRPVGLVKGNLNTMLSLSYSRSPSLINDLAVRTDALTLWSQVFLGTSASERFDLSVSYGLNGRKGLNDAGTLRSPDYLRHQGGVNLTWLPWGGLKLTSALDLAYTTDVADDLNPLSSRLDLGVGYKFMEGDRAEARVAVVDVFDQAQRVDLRVTDLYIEDRETQALGRFVLASLSYTIRPSGPAGGGPGIPPPGVIITRF